MSTHSIIDQTMLGDLLLEAAASPRLRKNRNFHPSDESACHRLLNALQPGTYVPPHRHMNDAKAETMLLLQGELGVLIFDEAGQVIARHHLIAGGEQFGVNIEARTFHSVVALTPCVFLEAKAGPYAPVATSEMAGWVKVGGEAEYLAWMVAQFN